MTFSAAGRMRFVVLGTALVLQTIISSDEYVTTHGCPPTLTWMSFSSMEKPPPSIVICVPPARLPWPSPLGPSGTPLV